MEYTKTENHLQQTPNQYIKEHNLEKIASDMLTFVVHERSLQPIVLMIKYLAGLLSEAEKAQAGIIIFSPLSSIKLKSKSPPNLSSSKSLLKNTLTKSLWSSIKDKTTKYGGSIDEIIKLSANNPKDKVGCIITDGDCISTFKSLFIPIINQINKTNIAINIGDVINETYNEDETDNEGDQTDKTYREYYCINRLKELKQNQIDYISNSIDNTHYQTVQYSISRNISDLPFMAIITNDKMKYANSTLFNCINALIKDNEIPKLVHYSFESNKDYCSEVLKSIGYDVDYIHNAKLNGSKLMSY